MFQSISTNSSFHNRYSKIQG